ncbi:MAG: hypothetical protein JST50_12540 [Bacteroidetes bacterium]|nr:hypothetical protein [Bacteroidota bacterium]
MKKFLFVIGMLIAFASVSKAQGYAYTYIKNYAQGMGYGIGQEWNAGLEQGQYFTKTFTFNAGVQYDIIALSDDGNVLDVDIEILTPSGYLYDRNSRTGKFAEVVFTPTYDRTLTIKVRNCGSETPYYASRVYFMVAYK